MSKQTDLIWLLDDKKITENDKLFFIEDLCEDLIKKFNTLHLLPYLKNVFSDLLLRSPPQILVST